MRSFHWLALGAAAVAIVGATAVSPGVARAASPPTCGNWKGGVCVDLWICHSYEGDVCTSSDEYFTYYILEKT